uniref:Uncharacterized protein n=1 Tax=Cacopsylla melanoneura TaxID=428564 RepID=A0A8D8WW77_9HEMI
MKCIFLFLIKLSQTISYTISFHSFTIVQMSEITILTLKNHRLIELLIKKNFIGLKEYNFKVNNNEIKFKLDYLIGKNKIYEKLEDVEGDFNLVNVSYTNLSAKEEKEMETLLADKK